MDYNFTVEYISGSYNKAADSFLRHPVDSPDESDETYGEMQTLFLRMCRLSQAQKADCSFQLERIRNATENDLEYQLSKTKYGKVSLSINMSYTNQFTLIGLFVTTY